MKLAPHNYTQHLDILMRRLHERAARDRAEEALVYQPPQRHTPPMSTGRRLAGYLCQGHRAAPTGRQLRRAMRKAGILDPAVVRAAWVDLRGEAFAPDVPEIEAAELALVSRIRGHHGGAVIYDEATRVR